MKIQKWLGHFSICNRFETKVFTLHNINSKIEPGRLTNCDLEKKKFGTVQKVQRRQIAPLPVLLEAD